MPLVQHAFRALGPILAGIIAPPPIPRVLDLPVADFTPSTTPPDFARAAERGIVLGRSELTGMSTGSKTWKPCGNHMKDRDYNIFRKRTQKATPSARSTLFTAT